MGGEGKETKASMTMHNPGPFNLYHITLYHRVKLVIKEIKVFLVVYMHIIEKQLVLVKVLLGSAAVLL